MRRALCWLGPDGILPDRPAGARRGVALESTLDTVQPGLRWNPPVVDEVDQGQHHQGAGGQLPGIMLTRDENIVEVKLSVQYVIDDPASSCPKAGARDSPCNTPPRAPCATWLAVPAWTWCSPVAAPRSRVEVNQRLQDYLNLYQRQVFW